MRIPGAGEPGAAAGGGEGRRVVIREVVKGTSAGKATAPAVRHRLLRGPGGLGTRAQLRAGQARADSGGHPQWVCGWVKWRTPTVGVRHLSGNQREPLYQGAS